MRRTVLMLALAAVSAAAAALPSTAESVGEKSWPKGEGPEAQDSNGKRIGEFAYAVLADPKDFSLIRLDSDVEASPEMCYFGGPSGMYDGLTPDPVVLQYFGEGIGVG